jgi:hypothetical protein
MAVDKEALMKHHFWILLGVFGLLVPVVVGDLMLDVSSAIAAQEKKIDEQQKKLKAQASKTKGQNYLDELTKQKEVLGTQRTAIWDESWKNQEAMFTWPEQLPPPASVKYFGDTLPDKYRDQFRKDSVYLALYEELDKELKPTTFLNSDWRNVLTYVPEWETVSKIPTNEDVWLALEDFWVQRELLRTIEAANRSAFAFTKVKDEKPAAGETFRSIFRSRLWELDLRAKGDGLNTTFSGTIKNLTGTKLALGFDGRMHLQVTFQGKKNKIPVPIEAEYVPADGKPFDFKPVVVGGGATLQTKGMESVEQELNLRTAPVKRIDAIALGYPSSRTNELPMKMTPFSQKEQEAEKAAQPQGVGGPGAGPPMGPMGGGFGEGGPRQVSTSPAQLMRERYIDTTAQVRRMPVALKVVIDQAHVQDLLLAFANSKLRFQETQVHWQRNHDMINGGLPGANPIDPTGRPGRPGTTTTPRRPPNAVRPATGTPPMGIPRFAGKGGRPGMGADGEDLPLAGGAFRRNTPAGPMGAGAGGQIIAGPIDETLPPTLVELSLYGIASLYEKPRDPADAAGAAGAPATPGAPAAPGAPK